MSKKQSKYPSQKQIKAKRVWGNNVWTVCQGKLSRGVGRPTNIKPLFKLVAEKLPYPSIDDVKTHIKKHCEVADPPQGVYAVHDSMGYVRYVGRGNIFNRIRARFSANRLELRYYSFYVVADKKHEREIETILIRSAGPQLHFNSKKKRVDILPGNVRDFEAGTFFYERHYKKGKRKSRR